MLRNKGGFTLIELVMIIVILGILAAVAIPRYADLRDEADRSNAVGVIGNLNSAASVAYAAYLTSLTRCNSLPASNFIDTGDELKGCLDGGLPRNWSVSGNNFVYTAGVGPRTFPILTVESATGRAIVQRTSTEVATWPTTN